MQAKLQYKHTKQVVFTIQGILQYKHTIHCLHNTN